MSNTDKQDEEARAIWQEYRQAIREIEDPAERCKEYIEALRILLLSHEGREATAYRPKFIALPSLMELTKEKMRRGTLYDGNRGSTGGQKNG